MFPAIPTPPTTVRAPVVVFVEDVAELKLIELRNAFVPVIVVR